MNRHIRKAMYMIGITALAVAFVHAAEVGGIITQQLDAGAAIKKSYDAKVARQDRLKDLKDAADGMPISEDFTTTTLAAINAAYARAMAVDLTQAKINAETQAAVMALKAEFQGFRAEAVNRQRNIAKIKKSMAFDRIPAELRAVGGPCIGLVDDVVSFFEDPARKEFIDYIEPRVIED